MISDALPSRQRSADEERPIPVHLFFYTHGCARLEQYGPNVALKKSVTTLSGRGRLFRGSRDLGEVSYRIEVSVNGQATLVQFSRIPPSKDGEVLHLALQDGRFLLCQHLDSSPYCSVIGDGPRYDRRRESRPPGEVFAHHP